MALARIATEIGAALFESGRLLPMAVRKLQANDYPETYGDCQRRVALPARLVLTAGALSGKRFDAASTRIESDMCPSPAYRHARRHRSRPALAFGQRFVTPASAVQRARLAVELAGQFGSDIVFIGDDDLVSIEAAYIERNLRITVLEIDGDLVHLLRSVVAKFDLPIRVVPCDVFAGVPTDLLGRFDLFVADPYPTPDACFELAFAEVGRRLTTVESPAAGLITYAPTHKAVGFEKILTRALASRGWSFVDLRTSCDYELFMDEFAPLEQQWLRRLDPAADAFSHSKGYLLIESAQSTASYSFDFDYDKWWRMVIGHDLVAQLGTRARMGEPYYAGGATVAPFTPISKGVALHRGEEEPVNAHQLAARGSRRRRPERAIDLTALLCDLSGCEAAGLTVAQHLAEERWGEALRCLPGSRFHWRDLRALYRAGTGSRQFTSWQPAAELYLLARLYESYFRPPNLLWEN